jgi:hypothetical protein
MLVKVQVPVANQSFLQIGRECVVIDKLARIVKVKAVFETGQQLHGWIARIAYNREKNNALKPEVKCDQTIVSNN